MAVADRDGWRAFGYRGSSPLSGRVNNVVPGPFAPLIHPRVEGMHAPFVGVTSDGTVRRGLRSLDATVKVDTAPIADAALTFLGALSAEQRSKACLAMDAPEWRTWTNVHVAFWRHGVLLDDLPPATRDLALGVLRATLSARGYDYALGIMELNELVAQLKDDHDSYGQWLYFLSIYGDPGVASRGAGRSTATTCASPPSCSTAASSRRRRSWAPNPDRSVTDRGSTSRRRRGCC